MPIKAREIQKLRKRLQKKPSDEEAFVRLWDHFVACEDWSAAANLLSSRADSLQKPKDRIRALLKLANLMDEKLGDVKGAADVYHKVLNLDPENRRALWALGVLYHDLEDWEKVIEIFLLRINIAQSLEEKLSLRSQLAAIYEQRLQQEDRALMEYIRAARLAPQNVRILLNMEKLATRTDSFRELLAVYEDVLERIERIELRVALYLKLARLYTLHLDDEKTAEGYYKRALELSTGNPKILFSISNIYGEEEEWEELIATYTQLIKFAESSNVKSWLRREVARLYHEGLDDPGAAFYELVRVARYDPSEKGLVQDLISLGVCADKHLELAAVLEDIGPRLDSKEDQLELYTRLAEIHLKELQNAEHAQGVISKALEVDPGYLPAMLIKFDLLETARDYEGLAKAIESILTRQDLSDDIAKQLRRRLAQIYEEKLGDRERAVELYRENMREQNQQDKGSSREELLEELHRRQGTYDELIKILQKRCDETDDPETLAKSGLEICEIYEKRMDQPQEAFVSIANIIRRAPTNESLQEEFFRLGRELGLTEKLREITEEICPTLPPEQATGFYIKTALCLESGGDPDGAIVFYEKALSADPLQPVAYQKLRTRALNHFMWQRVVELDLNLALHLDDPREKTELLLTAGELIEEQLDDATWAKGIYERALKVSPDNMAAQKALIRVSKNSDQISTPLHESPDDSPKEEIVETDITDEDIADVVAPALVEEHMPEDETDDTTDVIRIRKTTPGLHDEVTLVTTPPKAPEPFSSSEDKEPTLIQPPPMAPKESLPFDSDDQITKEQEPDEEIDHSPMEEELTKPSASLDPIVAIGDSLKKNPDDLEGWEKLASEIAEKQGVVSAFDLLLDGCGSVKDDKVLGGLLRRLSMMADTNALRLKLAHLLEELEKIDDAETLYRTVIRTEPANKDALDRLKAMYENRGSLDRYDAILTRTLNGTVSASDRRSLLMIRARIRAEELDRPNDAIEDLSLLLSSDDSDMEALLLLEKILETNARYEELVHTYEKHLPYCLTGQQRVDLMCAMAIIYENHLADADRAISLYRTAIEEDPCHYSARDSLVNLLEKKRDWLGAVDILRDAAQTIEDEEILCRIYLKTGSLLEQQLLRPEEAEQAYRLAAYADYPCPEAIRKLLNLVRRSEQWTEFIQLSKRLVQITDDLKEKARLLVDMANVWQDKLDNQKAATQCFEQAYECNPDNIEAARRVASHKLKTHKHEEAHELLSHLTQLGSQEGLDNNELALLQLKLAQTADALDRQQEAHTAFEKALHLDPQNIQIKTLYGHFLARHEKWKEATRIFLDLLEKDQNNITAEQAADFRCIIAQGYDKQGDQPLSLEQYKLALVANPLHLPALRACIDLSFQLGRIRDAVEYLKKLRTTLPSQASRMKISVQIGDILAERLHDHEQAVNSFEQAVEIEPNNIEVLEKLRRALVRSERFKRAAQVLVHLAHLANDNRQQARYLRIAGDIYRERIDDEDKALTMYLKAFDVAPLDAKAHGSAVKILSRKRDWNKLASLYEELLRRLPPPISGKEDKRISVLSELVELYRYKLENNEKAISACVNLLSIDPSQLKIREDLARLYEKEGHLDDAIKMHRSLIENSPFSVDSYHALRRIYELKGMADKSLCICSTLSFLDEADEDEIQTIRDNRHALAIPNGRVLTELQYSRILLHPASGGALGELLSFAADFVRHLFVVPHKEFKLRPKNRLDLEKPKSKTAEIFRDAIEFLDLPPPEIYTKSSAIKGILAVNTSPVSVLYSEEAVRRASIPELKFMIARAMVFTRPENLLAASLSAGQLRTLLEALVEVAFPGENLQSQVPEILDLADRLRKVVPANKQQRLKQLTGSFREQQEEFSIRDWLEGVEHTSNRAGFAFCGDLEAAVQILKAARVFSPSGSHRALIRELIFYSISDEYFTLRKELKASI